MGLGGTPEQQADMMRQAMSNPLVQSMMNNPDIMRSMIQSNPRLQQVMDAHPEMAAMLNDPNTMRETMRIMSNPVSFDIQNFCFHLKNLNGMILAMVTCGLTPLSVLQYEVLYY